MMLEYYHVFNIVYPFQHMELARVLSNFNGFFGLQTILAILGLSFSLYEKKYRAIGLICLTLIIFMILCLVGGIIQQEMRYVISVWPLLCILMTVPLIRLEQYTKPPLFGKSIVAVILIACFVLNIRNQITNHPCDGGMGYTIESGSNRKAVEFEEMLKIAKDEGIKNIYLNKYDYLLHSKSCDLFDYNFWIVIGQKPTQGVYAMNMHNFEIKILDRSILTTGCNYMEIQALCRVGNDLVIRF